MHSSLGSTQVFTRYYNSSRKRLRKASKTASELTPSQVSEEAFEPTASADCNSLFAKAAQAQAAGFVLQATALYKKALELAPKNHQVALNLGVCYFLQARYDKALSFFDEIANADSENERALFNQALALMYKREFAKALEKTKEVEAAVGKAGSDVKILKNFCLAQLSKLTQRTSRNTLTNTETTRGVSQRTVQDAFKELHERPMLYQVIKDVPEFDTRKISHRTSFTPKPVVTPCRGPKKNTKHTPIVIKSRRKHSQPPQLKSEESVGTLVKNTSILREVYVETFGLNQVEELQDAKSPLKKQYLLDEFDKKIKQLKIQTISEQRHLIQVDTEELQSKTLNVEQLSFIIREFKKPCSQRNYDKMHTCLKKLLFFHKFPQNVSIQLLKNAGLVFLQTGEVIFHQGDIGDKMYVILKGAIAVEKTSQELGDLGVIVNSLFDGSQFGELALNKPGEIGTNKRAATCLAAESSVLLSIPKQVYLDVLLKEMQEDIETKVKFLTTLPFFQEIDPNLLLPLASNLELRRYSYGDTIINKGDKPEGLYIMFKGSALACTEGFGVQHKYPSKYANSRKRRPRPPPIYIEHLSAPPTKIPQVSIFDQIRKREILSSTPRELAKVKDKLSSEKPNAEQIIVKERLPFATLVEKDYFGSRALLDGELIEDTEQLWELTPSKFSIVMIMQVVQSATATVFLITKISSNFLNEKVLSQVKAVLAKSYEVDCPEDVDPQFMEKMLKYWQSLRRNLTESTRRASYLERHKADFPFIR